MKRSRINRALREAQACFTAHGWALPPHPRWDVTDMGLGDFERTGLVLVNLAEEEEYCEKLMYARKGQRTVAHTHKRKKEDIIVRFGALEIRLWPERPGADLTPRTFTVQVNGEPRTVRSGEVLSLAAGERVTLVPGIYHEFWPASGECILGEVSTKNDDLHDNVFADEAVGRYPQIEEDEPATLRLIGEHA